MLIHGIGGRSCISEVDLRSRKLYFWTVNQIIGTKCLTRHPFLFYYKLTMENLRKRYTIQNSVDALEMAVQSNLIEPQSMRIAFLLTEDMRYD